MMDPSVKKDCDQMIVKTGCWILGESPSPLTSTTTKQSA